MLSLRDIGKSFGSARVLRGVSLDLAPGRVVGLLGANGAGKSTLVKVLTGVYPSYDGEVRLAGAPVQLRDPAGARRLGISLVPQEPDTGIFPDLSVAQNLTFDAAAQGGPGWRGELASAREALLGVGLDLDPRMSARELGLHHKQLLLIARALRGELRFLVLDEPTSALSTRESEGLFALVEGLRARGVGVVYVSHKLPEVERLCDEVVVLRDGAVAGRFARPLPVAEVVRAMLGTALEQEFPSWTPQAGEVLLEVRGLTRGPLVQDVSFEVRRGEVLAVTGLVGAGKTELLRTLFGAEPPERGEVRVAGRPVRLSSPRQALRRGVCLVPEERRAQGLFLDHSAEWNLSFPSLRLLSRLGVVRRAAEWTLARRLRGDLDIRGSLAAPVGELSGGNQQKVVLGKWLARDPRVLLLDEPTQGVDIGARRDLYRLVREVAREAAVVLATSDLDEALGVADRLLVMSGGRVAGHFARGELRREDLLRAALGQGGAGAA